MSKRPSSVYGPGPFHTLSEKPHRELFLIRHSRRHRKGLHPHLVRYGNEARHLHRTGFSPFRHLYAPYRIGWWVALSFMIGASMFTVAASAACFPRLAPAAFHHPGTLNLVFVTGAVFFTLAAWLQWLESINGDIHKPTGEPWQWFAWRPRDLGYLACSIQLFGTVMFNVNTIDATLPGLSWQQQDALVWTPNMIGCAAFLIASYLAYLEVSHKLFSWAPGNISWCITVINLAGSVAFQISALYSFIGPAGTHEQSLFYSNLFTALGGLCFFIGAYLLIPELFDEHPDAFSEEKGLKLNEKN